MPTQVLPTQIPEKSVATDTISLTEYNNIADSVSELIGRSGGNLLVNGGFEVWQRGAGSFTTHNAFTADRWYMFEQSGAVTVDRESTTVATNSHYAAKVVTSGLGSAGDHALYQGIEDFYQLRGKTISFSLRVHQSVASGVRITVDGATGGTTTSVTTGSWVTLTCTATVGSGATSLYVWVYFDAAGTYYLDNAMLVLGPNPTEYVPLHPQEELARCQRYYEFIGGVAVSIYYGGYQAAGNGVGFTLPYKVTKGGVPTVTKIGTWTVNNCGQPTANNPSAESFNVQATVTALGAYSFYTSNATDGFTVEWNP